jgi:hypothetical protein
MAHEPFIARLEDQTESARNYLNHLYGQRDNARAEVDAIENEIRLREALVEQNLAVLKELRKA